MKELCDALNASPVV